MLRDVFHQEIGVEHRFSDRDAVGLRIRIGRPTDVGHGSAFDARLELLPVLVAHIVVRVLDLESGQQVGRVLEDFLLRGESLGAARCRWCAGRCRLRALGHRLSCFGLAFEVVALGFEFDLRKALPDPEHLFDELLVVGFAHDGVEPGEHGLGLRLFRRRPGLEFRVLRGQSLVLGLDALDRRDDFGVPDMERIECGAHVADLCRWNEEVAFGIEGCPFDLLGLPHRPVLEGDGLRLIPGCERGRLCFGGLDVFRFVGESALGVSDPAVLGDLVGLADAVLVIHRWLVDLRLFLRWSGLLLRRLRRGDFSIGDRDLIVGFGFRLVAQLRDDARVEVLNGVVVVIEERVHRIAAGGGRDISARCCHR